MEKLCKTEGVQFSFKINLIQTFKMLKKNGVKKYNAIFSFKAILTGWTEKKVSVKVTRLPSFYCFQTTNTWNELEKCS